MAVIKKIGADFLVNTQSTSRQHKPLIPSLAEGGFVAIWRDFNGMLGGSS
jgi:hypothetical protein